MPPSTAFATAWPRPGITVAWLITAFSLSIALSFFGGRHLVEALLPTAKLLILRLDDHFEIIFLGIDHTHLDLVIRLKVNVVRMMVVGTHVVEPLAKGWIEVTTPVGALLQPLAIGVGLALAWPASIRQRISHVTLACIIGMILLLIDIPLTLHAYVWDMFLAAYDREHFSPLMSIHRFLNNGGRLGFGIAVGVVSVQALDRWQAYRLPHQ